jgi:hemoglobin/transferrin/lactoferrin receptor protein
MSVCLSAPSWVGQSRFISPPWLALVGIGLYLVGSPQALGQQGASEEAPVVQLGAVTVTATNFRETRLDDESKPVSVVNQATLATKAPISIVEAMRDVPGLHFSRAGGLGGQVVMRGFNSNDLKSPLAIDGERFRGRNTLEYNLIDPGLVEQVEVIRGPAAAIYGSEAMAGMVNIVTRKAKPDFGDTFSVRLQSLNVAYESVNNLRAGRLEVSGGGKGFDLKLAASARKAGDYDTPVGTAIHSQFNDQQLSGSLGYSFNAHDRLELKFKAAEVESHRAGGLGGAPGMAAPLAQRVYLREDPIRERYWGLAYSGKPQLTGIHQLDASVYVRDLYTDVVTTRYPNPTSISETHRYVVGPQEAGGKFMVVSDIVPDSILTAGLDFFVQDWDGAETEVKGTGTVASSARRKAESDSRTQGLGMFALLEHELNQRWLLSGNLRHDRYHTETAANIITIPALTSEILAHRDARDSKTTYAIGTVFKPSGWLNFAANFGTSYRVPTSGEKFSYGTYGKGYLLPNPSLQPEEGKTVDISARLRLPSLSANLTLYKSHYTNLIAQQELLYLDLVSSRRVNIGKAQVQGLELDLKQSLRKDLVLKLAAAYTEGSNKTAGKPLSYIAPLVGNVGLAYQHGPWAVEGDLRLSKRKSRIDSSLERPMSGYGVLNLYVGVDLHKLNPSYPKATLRMGIENLLDKAYADATTREAVAAPVSYTNPLLEPGRNFKISLTTQF